MYAGIRSGLLLGANESRNRLKPTVWSQCTQECTRVYSHAPKYPDPGIACLLIRAKESNVFRNVPALFPSAKVPRNRSRPILPRQNIKEYTQAYCLEPMYPGKKTHTYCPVPKYPESTQAYCLEPMYPGVGSGLLSGANVPRNTLRPGNWSRPIVCSQYTQE